MATDTPQGTGLDQDELSQAEQNALEISFKRAFNDIRLEGDSSVLKDRVWSTYNKELRFAAEVAKAQFAKKFDGANPDSGRFGIDHISPGYFGFNSWSEDFTDYTTAEVVDWLDDSAPNIGGSGGKSNPINIGEDAVHVVLGVGSYDVNPVTTRVKFEVNETPDTAISTRRAFNLSDARIRWLNSPKIFPENADVYAEAYGDTAGSDALYLVGASFVPEKRMREVDPAELGVEEIAGES
jgi:hypothetical protein